MGADASTSATGGFGLIITKATLRRLEIPVRHEITAQGGGWRLDLQEKGKVTAWYEEGPHQEGMDVEAGDYILSAGPDLYVSLQSLKVKPQAGEQKEPAKEPTKSAKARKAGAS